MNNVHEDEPVLFHTRWALSYLRGPLTREQIAQLMQERKASLAAARAVGSPAAAAPLAREEAPPAEAARPVVPPKVEERFLPALGGSGRLLHRPGLLGLASLHYANARAQVDVWESLALVTDLRGDDSARAPWASASVIEGGAPELEDEPEPDARFAPLPPAAAQPDTYVRWSNMLKSHLYRDHPLRLWHCRELKAISKPGESEGDFRVRLRQLLRERRDREIEELRKRFAPKLERIQERIRRAEERIAREQSQYQQQKLQTAVSLGATVLGALFGRKLGSLGNVGRATTAARGAGRASREREDVARARADLETLRQKLGDLEREFENALEDVRADVDALPCEELAVRPRKTDLLALAPSPPLVVSVAGVGGLAPARGGVGWERLRSSARERGAPPWLATRLGSVTR